MPEKMRPRGKRGVWYADCRHNGVRVRDCLETTDRRLAERRLAELLFSVDKGDYEIARTTFDELVGRYKAGIFRRLKPQLQNTTEIILRVHLVPAFAGMLVGQIVKCEALKYGLARNDLNIPQSSLKKELYVLKSIIRQVKPDFDIPSFKITNQGKIQTKFLTSDDIKTITSTMKPDYQFIVWFGFYTGLRRSDLLGLKWSEINLATGMISRKQSKTGTMVHIPICAVLAAMLRERTRVRVLGKDNLFDVSPFAYSKYFRAHARKAGFDWVRGHDLRHAFCSHLLNNGVEAITVARMAGHKNLNQLTARYGHISQATLKKAITAFDGVHKSFDGVHKTSTNPKEGSVTK